MDQTRREIGDQLLNLVNPRIWIDQYPWTSLGTVTAMGFLAASAVTPARKESFKQRMQTLFPQTPAAQPAAVGAAAPEPQAKSSLLQGLARPLLDAVKALMIATVSSAVQAKVQQPQEAASSTAGDGRGAYAPSEQQPVSVG
ncbi:MAG TPA: hypothetical protein VHP11_08505 [Tepidisphaeraceae bacterium]|nr:hypothetical protein [Tepidisphaeraceae bacterium]